MSVDLSSWEEKIHADPDDEVNDIDDSLPSEEKEGHEMFKDGVLTIGCVGKYMIICILSDIITDTLPVSLNTSLFNFIS